MLQQHFQSKNLKSPSCTTRLTYTLIAVFFGHTLRADFPHQSPRGLTNYFTRGPGSFCWRDTNNPCPAFRIFAKQSLEEYNRVGVEIETKLEAAKKESREWLIEHFNGAELRTSVLYISSTSSHAPDHQPGQRSAREKPSEQLYLTYQTNQSFFRTTTFPKRDLYI